MLIYSNLSLKKSFTLPVLILFCSPLLAQHYNHTAAWVRIAPSYTLNNSWNILAEGHYRRQSNPHSHLLNPLSSPLAYAYRAGVAYRTGEWTLTAWPLCWFNSYPALGKESDFSRSMVREFRPSLLLEWNKTLRRDNLLRIRGGYEYRRYTDAPAGGRWRFRIMARHNFTPAFYGYIWNETLWTGTPANANGHPFELNRSQLAMGHTFSKYVALETGYQFSHRQRKTLTEFDEEHALVITAHIRLNSN